MNLSKVVGGIATLVVVLSVLGALLALLTGPVLGSYALPAVVVVVVVAVAVVAGTSLGARSRRWLYNGGYW